MNKKILFSIITVLFISLFTYFVIADITGITLNTPEDNEIINGTYTFTATITGTADNVTFYHNYSEWTVFCFNTSTSTTFICDYDTSLLGDDRTYTFNATGWENSSSASDTKTNVIVDNTLPTITLDSPTDNQNLTSTTISFSFTPTDTFLQNCSLYGDWSGWGEKNISLNPTSGSANTFEHNITDGNYIWNVLCKDYIYKTWASNYTFSNGVPSVTLNTPSDNYWTNQTGVVFNCSTTDNGDSTLDNLTLFIWNSTTITDFSDVSGQTASGEWSKTLTANTMYSWNCMATDTANVEGWASSDRVVNIDTTIPTITSTGIGEGDEYTDDEDIDCSCIAVDNLDPSPSCGRSNCSSSVGDHIVIFTAEDAAENKRIININYSITSTGGGGDDDDGSGGGGDDDDGGDVGAVTKEHCWDVLEGGASIDYEVENAEIGVRKITIIPKENVTDACLEVRQVISITSSNVNIYSPSGKVYKYFKIEPSGITDDDLTSVIIEFSIRKTWFDNHWKRTVALNRYKDGWNALSTAEEESDLFYNYFSASSAGFSDFVITGDIIETPLNETVGLPEGCGDGTCSEDENSTICCQDCGCPEGLECRDNECVEPESFFLKAWEWLKGRWLWNLWFWLWILIALVIVAVVLAIIFREKVSFLSFLKKIRFPFDINFSIKKKPHYGFK